MTMFLKDEGLDFHNVNNIKKLYSCVVYLDDNCEETSISEEKAESCFGRIMAELFDGNVIELWSSESEDITKDVNKAVIKVLNRTNRHLNEMLRSITANKYE